MAHKIFIFIITIFLALSGFGCATIGTFITPEHTAETIARDSGLTKEYITSGRFILATYSRFNAPADTLRVYIEGDGRAWKTRRRLSDDPTPSNPVALYLAIADPSNAVAYIARPGQFPAPNSAECDPTYWSERRFASEVVEAFDKTIDTLKKKSGAKYVELVGYSGGGAIAVLVAARRSDVSALRTVAGNLDPEALCAYHNVSRLDGSMNPLDVAQKVSHIPQRHFVGSKDRTVPSSITESFVKKEGDTNCESITIVDGATHNTGWRDKWPELLSILPQ